YLQQAVDLISNEKSGAVSKKKVADKEANPIPLRGAFSQKIKVEGKEKEIKKEKETKHSISPGKEAPVQPQRKATPEGSPFDHAEKLDLVSIRKELNDKKEIQKGTKKAVASPLEEEVLQQIWQQHIASLKKDEKKQAANILVLASIHITGKEEV